MATGYDPFSWPFSWFELPWPLIKPTLRVLGLGNTAFDALFYDVSRMVTDLFLHGILVKGAVVPPSPHFSEMTRAFSQVDLDALANPAGSILVVDAGRPARVEQLDDVPKFISWTKAHGQALRSVSVTGVGSSALGSAAFAWNVSTALGEPVAAIVPGCGVADAIEQGFNGWLGVLNLWIAQMTQEVLEHALPPAARPDRLPTRSSNVLHAILKDVPNVRRVLGHSKGALAIKDAIQALPLETTQRLHVVTFGCSIAEDTPTAGYSQFLGMIDGVGLLSSWGHPSKNLIHTHHSTNSSIPLSMPVSVLTRLAMMSEATPPAPLRITYQPVEKLGQRRPLVPRKRRANGHRSLDGAKP
jgi:hypothetical protein